MPSARTTISARYYRTLEAYAARRRIHLPDLMSEFERDALAKYMSSGEYPFVFFATLLERCAVVTSDDAFGLDFAATLLPRPSGVFRTILSSSATLRDAFCGMCRICTIMTQTLALTYRESQGAGWIEFHFAGELASRPQFIGGELAVVALRVNEHVSPEVLPPHQVEFTFPAPRNLQRYTNLFGHNIIFGARQNRIAYPFTILHRPLHSSAPQHKSFVAQSAQQEDNRDIALRVADFIRGALQRGEATEDAACRTLAIGRRTLQRELSACGTSFRKILDRERRISAETYLTGTDLSLSTISALLGYSEQSAFSRACRVWFGQAPSAFRRGTDAEASRCLTTSLSL